MNLDEGMGHGHEPPTRRPTRRVLYIALAGLAAALIVVVAVRGSDRPDPAGTPITTTAPASPQPATTTPAADPADDGHDHAPSPGAPRAVWATLEAFMGGWTSTNPATRETVFGRYATAELAEGLRETRSENVVTQPRTAMTAVGASAYAAEFRVEFANVDTPIRVLLVGDPSSPSGWRVDTIERASGG